MTSEPGLDPDAALVLGIASTAMPFARSSVDQAERWLRVLRLHGEAGAALSGLGVSEGRLEARDERANGERGEPANGEAGDAIALVSAEAGRIANHRGAQSIGTTDVLVAVMYVYGPEFDRVLEAHGTDRAQVLARLGVELPDPGGG
jgi:hypothetical protein